MREPPPTVFDDGVAEGWPAQDQANAFGYACRETPELMPLPITLAHRMSARLDDLRRSGTEWLAPDGKSQVSVEYRDDRPARIHTISLTATVAPEAQATIATEPLRALIMQAFGDDELKPDADTVFRINAAVPYETGGPARHAGPHRPQEWHRYLWRDRAPKRGRALRQGPLAHRPHRRLCRAACRQECSRCRPCRALRGASRLRHRPGASALDRRRNVRHWTSRR